MPTDGRKQPLNFFVVWSMRRVPSALLIMSGLIWGASVSADSPGGGAEPKPGEAGKAPTESTKAVKPSTKGVTSATSAAKPGQPLTLTATVTTSHSTLKPDLSTKGKVPLAAVSATEEDSIARAIRTINDCQVQFQSVEDYTCTFYKRERIKGRMTPQHVMSMKVRNKPMSIYLRFEAPAKGREAIYIEGQNNGRILVHDVGLNKVLAGTIEIEPTSSRAMEENRHPITHAGIGNLIITIARRWSKELSPEESIVVLDNDITIGDRPCMMIESIHPHRHRGFYFYMVRVYIDTELNVPIRFEGYDWPKGKAPAELLEEYAFTNIQLNVGLKDIDFDTSNSEYAFGRF